MAMKKMKKRPKAEWVKALRSGKYEKGRGALCRDGLFCCLGVAREVCETGGISEELLEKCELDALGLEDSVQDKLVIFNDDKEWSFPRIAAYIERYL